MLFFVPLVDLATIGLRAASILGATRAAALVAGRSQSFQSDLDPQAGDLSAQTSARQEIERHLANCLGPIKVSSVAVTIIATPLQSGQVSIHTSPIAAPDPTTYIYQIEVTTRGTVRPLLLLNEKIFGTVPGLTTDFPVTFASREFAEHVAGLAR